MRIGVVTLGLAIGCGSSDPSPEVNHHLPTPAERAAAPKSSAERMFTEPAPAPTPAERQATLTAAWSRIQTEPGCFYFSGPDGRDDRLAGPVRVERNGEDVTLTIGKAIFTGSYKAGELYAERHSSHDFYGPWTVTETLHGRYLEGIMRARYHYAECAPDQPCPGHCTIDATVAFLRRPQ